MGAFVKGMAKRLCVLVRCRGFKNWYLRRGLREHLNIESCKGYAGKV